MTTILKRLNTPSALIILVGTWFVLDLVLLGRANDLSKSDWAAWVQAIGSIGAILVAVGVARHQSESQRQLEERKERDDVAGLLRCLRSDMAVSLEQLSRGIGPMIQEMGPDSAFRIVWPISENPFPIYHGLIPKLGTIRDDKLRDQIVRAYAAAQSFIHTIRFNNELEANMRKAESLVRGGMPLQAIHDIYRQPSNELTRYGHEVRISFQTVLHETNAMMTLLANI
jgi:hypothetical protein